MFKTVTGYYLNLFEECPEYGTSGRDVFIIFNEANPKPEGKELDVIASLAENIILINENEDDVILEAELNVAISKLSFECVSCGIQVIVKEL